MRKLTIIGGAGVRTPLVINALAQDGERLGIGEIALYDIDTDRRSIIAALGREIVRRLGSPLRVTTADRLDEAADSAAFVLSSIRVGGIAARARDERIAIELGLAGQETTGPGGTAMALRTIPVTLAHARMVERIAPRAWFINFTNPAGLITQALSQHTGLRVIGICDTPVELCHRIAWALGAPFEEMTFDYAGLNHLGWIRTVTLRGEDITPRLLDHPETLRRLYPAGLFDPVLIQTLRLIPTEYLFFYYSHRKAHENQLKAGASRGEELDRLNTQLFSRLARESPADGLSTYRSYLLRRNSSYMKLEAEGESAFDVKKDEYDPFETVTGYHRIAIDVITGLVSERPHHAIVNVPNHGAVQDLDVDDVVEVLCDITAAGASPRKGGSLPFSVRGLVTAVKAYERTAIRAAVEQSPRLAQLAMMLYPPIGQWELSGELLRRLVASDREHLGYLA